MMSNASFRKKPSIAPPRASGFLYAVGLLVLAALITLPTHRFIGETATAMVFLTAVLVAAVRLGFWVGVLTAIAALFTLNFLFHEPRYTLLVTHPRDLVTLAVFLLVATLTGLLAGRMREERDAAQGRATVLSVLSNVSTDLFEARTAEDILTAALRHLSVVVQGPVMVLARDGEVVTRLAAIPATTTPSAADLQAADQALRHRQIEFAAAQGWGGSAFTFVPVIAGDTQSYVLGHTRFASHLEDLHYREEAVAVIRRQTELALQRLSFAANAEAERKRAETEALRSTLLASLSHDLRTPLATILGSVTTLRDLGGALPADAQTDLLEAIEQEAGRLNRYVDNLLQMTRLQSGFTVNATWVDAADVARAAARRARLTRPSAVIEDDLPDLPMIRAEASLLEQALFNLLENAAKYTDGPITLSAQVSADQLTLRIADRGSGLNPALAEWLRTEPLTGLPESNGLGLPIAKGIAHVLGGSLAASSRSGGGTIFALTLPVPQQPAT
ncbi:DUF4118 domain-containing protein [Paracoccus amoyensis]|nr:DUF4118 domain-containing protein [Paracoccus amoyensis]